MTEPPAGAVANIFISYARDDAAFAARLRDGIEAGGFSVWMDTASMAGGERYTKEIESAIEGATSVVVVVSGSSNESVWVRREALYAQQLGKRVMPMLATQVSLPIHLINLNVLDLHEDFNAGFEQLLSALQGQTASAATAAGKRTPPVHMGKALWLFVGAAVLVVLAVIIMRGGGAVAEVLATGLAIGGALLAMAWKADDAISLEFKRDLSLWLDGIDPATVGYSVQRWPTHFAAMFDRVFGKKHLSWRCFFRSSIASLLAFLLCTLIYMQAAPGEWAAFISEFDWVERFMWMGGFVAIVNLLPDYVSLLETRWVIDRMQRTPSFAGQLVWLLVDFIATTVIFLLCVTVVGTIFALGESGIWEEARRKALDFTALLVQVAMLVPIDEPEIRFSAIPVWTTYFTTAWVWLYFFAQFLVRLVTPLCRTLGFLKYALPVEQRPLHAVGQVMALVAGVSYCLLMLPASILDGSSKLGGYLEPEMVDIKPGEFKMGCVSGKECGVNEFPVHSVTFHKPFAIGKHHVTFEEYEPFAKATERALPDSGSRHWKKLPITVTWLDAIAYTEWLSEQTGHRYRLPTEAEWEYAARAGTKTMYWWGEEISENPVNCDGCGNVVGDGWRVPVDSFEPNPWGLYNTAQNDSEWTQDCWHDGYKGEGRPDDGSAWEEADGGNCGRRMIRGGAWFNDPEGFRSAYRFMGKVDSSFFIIGFRLAQDR